MFVTYILSHFHYNLLSLIMYIRFCTNLFFIYVSIINWATIFFTEIDLLTDFIYSSNFPNQFMFCPEV
jgi:hypothetical protein